MPIYYNRKKRVKKLTLQGKGLRRGRDQKKKGRKERTEVCVRGGGDLRNGFPQGRKRHILRTAREKKILG